MSSTAVIAGSHPLPTHHSLSNCFFRHISADPSQVKIGAAAEKNSISSALQHAEHDKDMLQAELGPVML